MNKLKTEALRIGGISVDQLKEQFSTPLYVYQEDMIEKKIDVFKKHFVSKMFKTTIVYASKAFLVKEMVKLVSAKGLNIDAVSLGELYTIKQSGFHMSGVVFHGNNKSKQELEYALETGVGTIVVDNLDELEMLFEISEARKQAVNSIIRVNPGIEAHTHEYIQTSLLNSKFGISIYDVKALNQIYAIYDSSEYLKLNGFHCHIGSQITALDGFEKMIEVMIDFAKKNMPKGLELLNLGGGFGVKYTDETPYEMDRLLDKYVDKLETVLTKNNYHISEIMIEPGRSIVANAGTTLYTVGSIKETYGKKNYIFIDGGMTDNIRPALYQAKYDAVNASKIGQENALQYTIAGKCCESGDVIIKDIMLPVTEKGDVIAVSTTGAYGYSMASNYNRLQRPAVVFVKDGESRVVVKRETLEDLVKNDA